MSTVKFKNIITSLVFSAVSSITFSAQSATIFEDSFESGDLSTTNSEGFSWGRTNRTGIVTSTQYTWKDNTISNEPIPAGSNWEAKSGEHSLIFHYAAGVAQSEEQFDLGTPHKDIWLRYWLRVPENYIHSVDNSANRKLFALWMDGYSANGDGPTIVWEFWGNGADGSNLAFHYSEGGHTGAGRHLQSTPFISYPSDQGRRMQIVIHVKSATNSASNDGVIQMWRRWENEGHFTKLHDTTTANIAAPSGGPNGWKTGYIMGWANAAYLEDTDWLVDDFTVSAGPLITSPKQITSVLIE